MAVDSGTVSNLSVARKKERVKSPLKKEQSYQSQENAVASSPAKRNKSPGIRLVGGRIYDSVNGKTCHQCRQKTRDFVAACKIQRNNKPCTIMYCHKCLLNRYGEEATEVDAVEEWSCPRCRGICNCSICMKKRGQQPTGILVKTATGFSSVSEMLIKGAEHLNHEKVITYKIASPKKEIVPVPRKRGKENSFDEKVDVNLPNHVDKKSKKVKEAHNGNLDDNTSQKIISQTSDKRKLKHEETGSHGSEKKPKKSKDDLEDGVSNKNIDTLARRTSPRKKLKVPNNMSNQGTSIDIGVDPNENTKANIILTRDDFVQALENGKSKHDNSNTANDKIVEALIPLPMGIELNKLAGVDVQTEDIGNALQFLEFCSVFRKILDVKKGQPELVLKDLLHGRTGRRGKFSLTVQFHIHLLSILKAEQGEECTELSPSHGKSSWFRAFKECMSESQGVLKAHGLDSLSEAADYESLEASEKLRLLNLLCDEILGTEKVRNWMDDQNTELAEKIKEAKREVLAAKGKEKSLKQKMKDDIAQATIARHGAPLSISEHEGIISRIKREADKAHAKVLDTKGIFLKNNRTSDAVRIEPIFVGRGGHAYWKLNGSCKTDVLHQIIDTEKGDAPTLGEKWFALDDEGKEAIEKHICSF